MSKMLWAGENQYRCMKEETPESLIGRLHKLQKVKRISKGLPDGLINTNLLESLIEGCEKSISDRGLEAYEHMVRTCR